MCNSNRFSKKSSGNVYLTPEERQVIIRSLSKKQRGALHIFSKLSQASFFANVLGSHKGTKRFIFDGFVDHGSVRRGITCLCGKTLRYEFILRDIRGGEKISLGRTHFQRELDIPDHIARLVHKGIHQINIELDEILNKYWSGEPTLPQPIVEHMHNVKLTEEIECLLLAGLPLLRRHIDYLYDATKKYRMPYKSNDQFEVLSSEFKDIHCGRVNYYDYISENYEVAIDDYMRKSREFVPAYRIIEYLVANTGLKNQLLYGQHALHRYFQMYLSNHPNYVARKGSNEFGEFKHIMHVGQKSKIEKI